MSTYQLPCHPSTLSSDPLGVLDEENPPQWQVLDALIATASLSSHDAVNILPTLIEDLAYTVHGNGIIDTAYLRAFLAQQSPDTLSVAVARLSTAALALPDNFPSHTLETLHNDNQSSTYTAAQVSSLLAHQFLGTLSKPSGNDWGFPNFTSWFAVSPAHPQAVHGYLSTILHYFANDDFQLATKYTFSFTLHTARQAPDPSTYTTIPHLALQLTTSESEPSSDTSPSKPFVLVPAHSQPGPGATGTQEERLQSASPVLSLSALVVPRIPDDAAVVTSVMPVHASWRGHNRTARLETLYKVSDRPKRYYILADALQIDETADEPGVLRDLKDGMVEREVRKLYAAFSGAVKMRRNTPNPNPGSPISTERTCVIETGAWGCGAFGGSLPVKSICMMIAAGMVGEDVDVRLTLLEERLEDWKFVQSLNEKKLTTQELWKIATTARTLTDMLRLGDR